MNLRRHDAASAPSANDEKTKRPVLQKVEAEQIIERTRALIGGPT